MTRYKALKALKACLNPATVRRRVKRGAAYFDAHLAFNWRKRIKDDLCMDDEHSCVVGQVFGNYTDGLVRLARLNGAKWVDDEKYDAYRASVSHGFQLPKWSSTFDVNEDDLRGQAWSLLELAWRKELAK